MTETEKTFYKIRRKTDNLYSAGGRWPHFTKKGKIWRGMGPLRNHLNIVDKKGSYDDCEVIVLRVVEIEEGCMALDELMQDQKKKRAERLADLEARMKAWEKKRAEATLVRIAEWERLNKKHAGK